MLYFSPWIYHYYFKMDVSWEISSLFMFSFGNHPIIKKKVSYNTCSCFVTLIMSTNTTNKTEIVSEMGYIKWVFSG